MYIKSLVLFRASTILPYKIRTWKTWAGSVLYKAGPHVRVGLGTHANTMYMYTNLDASKIFHRRKGKAKHGGMSADLCSSRFDDSVFSLLSIYVCMDASLNLYGIFCVILIYSRVIFFTVIRWKKVKETLFIFWRCVAIGGEYNESTVRL